MTPRAVFYQECPVCGRSLRLPVQYFGKTVACPHCGGMVRATSEASNDHSPLPGTAHANPPASLPQLPLVESPGRHVA